MTDDLRSHVLVDVTTLAADLQLGGLEDPVGGAPVLLDVRWELGRTDGRDRYEAGHLPGAVFVDLESELAATPSAAEGRHPLPSASEFQAAARRWGVSDDSRVVVYDAVGGTSAARAWWLLRWFGHPAVHLLDGGLAAWERAGFPLETGSTQRAPGNLHVHPGRMPVLDADDAADLADDGVLLDARAAERYRGEVEPVDPQAGHVPGAVSAPTGGNLAADGTFLPTEDLERRFAALGATDGAPVGVYCGSGVTAAHQVAALECVGVRAALYPGSWSQWSNDPSRPVATG
ncbi:thiosulfate/3-mercaptopyruvate sulfurtransferase [Isoptericola jiangsuensis]|uniref:Thiosulfate/3-mercaptopyruvate sulfurtransferase n=1 Tax=Isoptericola jiangsuensis TaxID=548579 RepID=A0A2A9EVH9_9MICO|nr:sulfurtransferase [Isoptericola jiangsuensis]PFG42245.1 thiosulfate/3-mercaptopyruvate sulfurtransferase [Isoptericola jiangsuensis]